jgi:hypothetical protein
MLRFEAAFYCFVLQFTENNQQHEDFYKEKVI